MTAFPISWLSRLFNIMPASWPRVSECWLIMLFFKIGSGIGWTVLTAAFVSKFGIAFLPTLFVLNAVLIIAGTFFFERLIMRMEREVLMILMLILAATCLFFASFLYDRSLLAFFALIIFAESVFLAQFNVFIPILVADRFTPMESQRTIPFIESGETIGGIVGGILVAIFGVNFPISWFLYLWIIFLSLAIFVFVIAGIFRSKLPPLPFRMQHQPRARTRDQITMVFQSIQRFPFLKGIVLVVLLQWVFMNVLEFQYTKALEQSVSKDYEETIASRDPAMFHAAILRSEEGTSGIPHAPSPFSESKLSSAEQALFTEQLGAWKGIFHFAALIIQILLASRLITSLGVIGAMLLHPIIMLMSLTGMFLKFGFVSSVVARLNFEVTNVVYKNAYLASHYALPKHIRDQAVEFLEGIVRPMGTLVGMLFILGFQMVFGGKELSMWIHMIMFTIMGVVLVSTIRLQSKYTKISKEQLFSELPYPEKLNAIEILAQRGHDDSPMILVQKLRHSSLEPPVVRVKIVSALGRFQDYRTLPHLLASLSDAHPDVRLEAAYALMNFSEIGEKFYSQAFSRFRMIETLKETFKRESSSSTRGAIIRLFSLLREVDTVPFLLNILKESSDELRADCIYTIGLFHDPNTAFYITPYLDSSDPKVVASSIVALWQFPLDRAVLQEKLQAMLNHTDPRWQKAGIFVLGETQKANTKTLQHHFASGSEEVRHEAAFALTKCAEPRGAEYLIKNLLEISSSEFDIVRRFTQRLSPRARGVFGQVATQMITEALHQLRDRYGDIELKHVDPAVLERLRRLYVLLDQHEELFQVESALSELSQEPAVISI